MWARVGRVIGRYPTVTGDGVLPTPMASTIRRSTKRKGPGRFSSGRTRESGRRTGPRRLPYLLGPSSCAGISSSKRRGARPRSRTALLRKTVRSLLAKYDFGPSGEEPGGPFSRSKQWWAVRDSNPRHPRCKRDTSVTVRMEWCRPEREMGAETGQWWRVVPSDYRRCVTNL